MITTHTQPKGVQISENKWWFVVTAENTVKYPPMQTEGALFSLLTLVVADTLEECYQYIQDNNLFLPAEDDIVDA